MATSSLDVPLPEVFTQVTPLEIPSAPLAGKVVVALRSSLHFSYAITADGEVYRWGWKGIVTRVQELAHLFVRDIQFGYVHAVLLAEPRAE
ncbi:MAG: hypothetical protein EOO41_02485 [Methanobacteriota archaeon]|nr:MAG: hypothetical protein EOO41_02485 [Euryarchaeota archaeon]